MPAKKTQDEQEKSQPEESNPVDRQLSFVGRFIDKYYLKQSKAVQTGTFIVFVLLFAYGFLNILNGKYVLKGNLLKATASGVTYAPYYGVRWGTEDFASNSRGEYYVALGFGEYMRAVISGEHEVIFLQPGPSGMSEQVAWSGNVTVNRLDGEFKNVTISYSAPAAAPAPSGLEGANRIHSAPWSLLVPAAWASEAAGGPGVYQLLVQNVRLSSGAAQGKATIELTVDNQQLELRDRNMSDLTAGPLPLPANQNIDLGSNLYFGIPGNSLPVRGQVRVTAPASGFFQISNYQEEFPLPAEQSVGQALQLRGSRGGAVTARIVFSQPLKLYREADWAAKKDNLEAAFLSQGFVVKWADPPLGALAETNALWTGPMVPFDVVQRLLRAAVSQQIPLKKVQYRYQFRSSPNPTEMQIGSSKACANFESIPTQALQQAIDASSEDAFQRVIAPYTCSATSAVRSMMRRRPARQEIH